MLPESDGFLLPDTYTPFGYSGLVVDGRTVRCTVTNTGHRDADEVVQLYVRDLVADVSRPVKELKGFQASI